MPQFAKPEWKKVSEDLFVLDMMYTVDIDQINKYCEQFALPSYCGVLNERCYYFG